DPRCLNYSTTAQDKAKRGVRTRSGENEARSAGQRCIGWPVDRVAAWLGVYFSGCICRLKIMGSNGSAGSALGGADGVAAGVCVFAGAGVGTGAGVAAAWLANGATSGVRLGRGGGSVTALGSGTTALRSWLAAGGVVFAGWVLTAHCPVPSSL